MTFVYFRDGDREWEERVYERPRVGETVMWEGGHQSRYVLMVEHMIGGRDGDDAHRVRIVLAMREGRPARQEHSAEGDLPSD